MCGAEEVESASLKSLKVPVQEPYSISVAEEGP